MVPVCHANSLNNQSPNRSNAHQVESSIKWQTNEQYSPQVHYEVVVVKKAKANQGELFHYGMADASSAVAIGDDRFLVVSDERNVFQVFDRNSSGRAIDETSFTSMIELESKKLEADIEGSATIGDITYWIGSHSRDKEGALALNRHQLFATTIKDKTKEVLVRAVGFSYNSLLNDLLLDTEFRKLTIEDMNPEVDSSKSSKEKGAVSIEGLTSWQNKLLVGFRNPIPKGKAIAVPVLNPLEVVLYASHAEFGDFLHFDLGGRGIRSMDYWPERDIFIIVGGAFDQKNDFAYFTWTGKAKDKPKPIELVGVSDMHTEAVVFFEGEADGMLLLSDDGAKFKDKKNKDKELCFRTKWVTF